MLEDHPLKNNCICTAISSGYVLNITSKKIIFQGKAIFNVRFTDKQPVYPLLMFLLLLHVFKINLCAVSMIKYISLSKSFESSTVMTNTVNL